ncbi:hypothetical protein CO611_05065 [Lysobacteraceae bacterium NML03-0222]|nr:hypothetical protein CO611_05065 [Xanthomonadaceae bacterium NML03-0222]
MPIPRCMKASAVAATVGCTTTRHSSGSGVSSNACKRTCPSVAPSTMAKYLPQLCASSNQLLGLEVRLQWQHPESGEVSPGVFLPHAQRSGEIIPLGNWALRQVCLQIRRWRDAGLTPPPVGIDICCHQLAHHKLSQIVEEALAEAGIPGQSLIFEIDEQALLKEDPTAIPHIDQLRAMGIGFAIDNFGAQHAALNCLQKIPACQLKFSPRWLQNALRNPADAALCRATLELARTLGLDSVALGVNEAQLLTCAQQLPFTQLQGRQLATPLNAQAQCARLILDGFVHDLKPARKQNPRITAGVLHIVSTGGWIRNPCRPCHPCRRRPAWPVLPSSAFRPPSLRW